MIENFIKNIIDKFPAVLTMRKIYKYLHIGQFYNLFDIVTKIIIVYSHNIYFFQHLTKFSQAE